MIRKIYAIKFIVPSFLNRVSFWIRKIKVGDNFRTYGRVFVRGKGSVSIGKNVTINSCREANPIGGDMRTIIFAKDDSMIKIGDGVGISNSAIVAMREIVIEDNVFIGGSCKIYDHDFHSIFYEERISEIDSGVKFAPVCIKKGAFIGAHTIILKGVIIGEKSVIGAGSVVTKSVPDNEVWAGNPARFVKRIK